MFSGSLVTGRSWAQKSPFNSKSAAQVPDPLKTEDGTWISSDAHIHFGNPPQTLGDNIFSQP